MVLCHTKSKTSNNLLLKLCPKAFFLDVFELIFLIGLWAKPVRTISKSRFKVQTSKLRTMYIIPQEQWQLVQGFKVDSIQKEWDISNPISIGRLATTAWQILTNYLPNGINMQSFDLRTSKSRSQNVAPNWFRIQNTNFSVNCFVLMYLILGEGVDVEIESWNWSSRCKLTLPSGTY